MTTGTENAENYQFCVNLLKNKIFLGHYAGRHRVDEIDEFRDVINLHSTEEELKKDIDTVLRYINKSGTSVWVALSDSSSNGVYSLWVQLDGIGFGHYWFQIKHVRLTSRELFCVVSVLRSVPAQLVNPTFTFSQGFECAMRALRGVTTAAKAECNGSTDSNDANTASSAEPNHPRSNHSRTTNNLGNNRHNGSQRTTNREPNNDSTTDNHSTGDSRPFSFLTDLKGVTFDQIKTTFSNEESGVGLMKMVLFCLFFTIIGAMNLLYECLIIFTNLVVVTGDVTIRGLHACARLIESVSPLFLGVLNFVGKLVTGLYILIAMVCGCTPYVPQGQQRPPPPKRQALMFR